MNWALYETQVQSIGVKGHKGKFVRGIFSRSVICLNSPGAETMETIDITMMFSGEKKSP